MIAATFLIFALPLAVSQAAPAPVDRSGNDKPSGIIQGMVRDAQEHPVAAARVHVQEVGMVIKAAPVLSDEHGRFEVRNLRPGRYMVFASKEEANYADTESRFYGDTPDEVSISKEKPIADVIVQLPPAAAVLIGTVTDAKSKHPVPGAQIRISQTNAPTRWIQLAASLKTADFRVLVPSNRRIKIEFYAAGYRASMIELEGLLPNVEHKMELELTPK